jgi:hypothetical protein
LLLVEHKKLVGRVLKKKRNNTNKTTSDSPQSTTRNRDYMPAFRFVAERIKIYNSAIEAYIDGYIDGRESK